MPVMAAASAPPVVRMVGASVGYGDRPAIRDIDFTLDVGEVVVVLGPNGAGKSTLVRGILGLAPMISGSLELFGMPAAKFHERHRLGYVPQRHTIVGGVPSTVREVVSSGRLPRKRPFAPLSHQDREAIESAIDTVGLAERADVNVATLSGGQQRRVLIARALAAEPDVLVLDEPTAGVDSANQEILAATLRGLVEQRGRTLLLVAHELGPLEPLIGRVLVMRDGHIRYDGAPVAGGEGIYRSRTVELSDHHHSDEHRPTLSGPLGLARRLP